MARNSVFGENMDEEKHRELLGGYCIMTGNENTLLCSAVNNDENGCKSVRGRELLDEIHGNGMPRSLRDGERSEKPVRAVTRRLIALTMNTRLTVITDKGADFRLDILATDHF